MKKHLFLATALFLVCSMAYSQSDSKSSLSALLSRNGIVLQKEVGKTITSKTETVKSPGSFYYKTVVLTDVTNGIKIGGLKVVVWNSYFIGSKYQEDEYSAFLDIDEMEAVFEFLMLLSKKIEESAPEQYTELMYVSRDGFEIGAYFNPENKSGGWKAFLQTGPSDKSLAFFYTDDIPVMAADFRDAITAMKKATR